MSIIGINCYLPDSGAVAINNHHISHASKESSFSLKQLDNSFPRQTLRWIRETTSIDSVIFPLKRYKDRFETDIKPFCKRIEYVEHLDALGMSAVSVTNWSSCAVAVFDSFYTALGYFAEGQFHWIFRFDYPNTISLFYSAATAFVGYKPIIDEHKMYETIRFAEPSYANLMLQNIVNLDDSGYNLRINLERGLGIGPYNENIASSAQSVYTTTVLHLLRKLQSVTSLDKLAIAGIGARNIATNYSILNDTGYNHIATHPAASGAALAQGAAALFDRPIWENCYLGVNTEVYNIPDQVAGTILNHEELRIKQGRKAFADNNLGNTDASVFIPYSKRIKDDVYLVVQDSEYNSIFTGEPSYSTISYARIKIPQIKTVDGLARVLTVTSSSNPYINRLLEITKSHGYPVLAVRDNAIYT